MVTQRRASEALSLASVTHIKRNRIYAKNRLQAEARGAIILYLDYVSS